MDQVCKGTTSVKAQEVPKLCAWKRLKLKGTKEACMVYDGRRAKAKVEMKNLERGPFKPV